MDLAKIQSLLKTEQSYRLAQIKKLIFKDLICNWQEATTLPINLRTVLEENTPLQILAETFTTKDGQTTKALLTLNDGLKVESVLMRYENRNTVCVSSMVGCPLACVFCATGKMGFKRNLDASEMVDQVLFFARILRKENRKVTNVVFMGMGEPFLNYDNVILAIRLLNDKDNFGLGARHFSISTVGIPSGIEKLARESLEVNLALSLHATTDDLRSSLMPINGKFPLETILQEVENYIRKTHRKVMLEYVLIRNINDKEEDAKNLARLAKGNLFHVNLIRYNPTGIFEPSTDERARKFKEILVKKGVSVTERFRFGEKISAACGQLAGKN